MINGILGKEMRVKTFSAPEESQLDNLIEDFLREESAGGKLKFILGTDFAVNSILIHNVPDHENGIVVIFSAQIWYHDVSGDDELSQLKQANEVLSAGKAKLSKPTLREIKKNV